MEVSIRPVRPDDAEALTEILNPIIATGRYTIFDTPFSVEHEREFIERFPPRGLLLGAEIEGRIVGFQVLEPIADYTHAFDHVASLGTFVKLDLRRRGLARKLFEATFRAAREKGYEKLFTFVGADNPGALAAYKSQGFTEIGRATRQAKVNGAYVDELMIEKFL